MAVRLGDEGKRFPAAFTAMKPYLRVTPQPDRVAKA